MPEFASILTKPRRCGTAQSRAKVQRFVWYGPALVSSPRTRSAARLAGASAALVLAGVSAAGGRRPRRFAATPGAARSTRVRTARCSISMRSIHVCMPRRRSLRRCERRQTRLRTAAGAARRSNFGATQRTLDRLAAAARRRTCACSTSRAMSARSPSCSARKSLDDAVTKLDDLNARRGSEPAGRRDTRRRAAPPRSAPRDARGAAQRARRRRRRRARRRRARSRRRAQSVSRFISQLRAQQQPEGGADRRARGRRAARRAQVADAIQAAARRVATRAAPVGAALTAPAAPAPGGRTLTVSARPATPCRATRRRASRSAGASSPSIRP